MHYTFLASLSFLDELSIVAILYGIPLIIIGTILTSAVGIKNHIRNSKMDKIPYDANYQLKQGEKTNTNRSKPFAKKKADRLRIAMILTIGSTLFMMAVLLVSTFFNM